jgi:iron complex transport system ATP-binding protein
MLRNLVENRNMGIVVSTHSIEYAESYCDRIMVVNKGRARIAPAKNARAEGLFDWAEA